MTTESVKDRRKQRRLVLIKEMGERLREARLLAGFQNAEDLAKAIGQHPAAYRKYERGESVPPLDILEKIRKAIKRDADWILLGR